MSRTFSATILVLANLCLLSLPASAQQMELIWKIGGNEVGATTYQRKADGAFESVTEMKVAGSAVKSRVAGKISGGALVEYEELNNIEGRKEVKVSARDGKAHITTNNETKDVDYKPSKILFSNYHPVLCDTIIKALNPAKAGTQAFETLILEAAENVKIEVLKKEARTVQSGGKRLVADVYLLRFESAEEMDLYFTDGMQFAAWVDPSHQDVLVYKTAPMTQSLEIGGPIELDLYFSTSARDTDFFAYLVDIDEQGVMRAIGLPGKIRAKYLNGWDQPTLLVPDKVYLATIAPWDTAHQFKKGHRLGVVIQSQMFPSYARNLNTGEPIKNATRMVAASQTIYHDAKRPSQLRFYLLPAAEK